MVHVQNLYISVGKCKKNVISLQQYDLPKQNLAVD